MRLELYGIAMEAPGATVCLWSPWRCLEIEHKLFNAIAVLRPDGIEKAPDEWTWDIPDVRVWKQVLNVVARTLKGWQEEGHDTGSNPEKRAWRWLMEADTDVDGYDHGGEKAAMWAFLRLSIDRGDREAPEKGEDLDLNGFGIRFWNADETKSDT